MVDRLKMDTRTKFDVSTLVGAYAPMNGTGPTQPVRSYKIYNASNRDVDISLDGGTTDHDIAPAGSTFIYDAQSNAQTMSGHQGNLGLAKQQVISGKAAGGGSGFLYICYFL